MLLYLGDSSIEREGLGPLTAAVADQVFRAFLARLARDGRTPEREALLLDHALHFLAHCCHRFARLRSAAFSFLVQASSSLLILQLFL